MNCSASLPPALSAAIKNRAFKIETFPTAIMQTVKAGFISPPETWKADMARVAMLSPLVNAVCKTEFGVLFHVKPVPQARNRYKSVVKNSAKTSIQKKRESKSVFAPKWRAMLLLVMCEWNLVEKSYVSRSSLLRGSETKTTGLDVYAAYHSAYIINWHWVSTAKWTPQGQKHSFWIYSTELFDDVAKRFVNGFANY